MGKAPITAGLESGARHLEEVCVCRAEGTARGVPHYEFYQVLGCLAMERTEGQSQDLEHNALCHRQPVQIAQNW